MSAQEHAVVASERLSMPYSPKLKPSAELFAAIKEAPRGTVLTYGATPLDQIATLHQQQEAQFELRRLTTHAPDTIPMEIVSYVQDTFIRRFIKRGEANNENFVTRLVTEYLETLDPEYIEIIDRARLGHASPAELILVRDFLGIRSVELACITHPYGEHIETLDEAREVVRAAAELYGGEYIERQDARYRIKDLIGEDDASLLVDGQSPGLLMTRKRTIAHLPDGTIVRERSSFVLRLDVESRLFEILGSESIEAFKAIRLLDGDDQESALKMYKDVISEFLLLDEFDEAIPVSTTIYAYNKETAVLVESASTEREAQNQKFNLETNGEMTEEEWKVQQAIDEERRAVFARYLEETKENMFYLDSSALGDD